MSVLTTAAILIAANMCLRGGEQVDVSPYISRAANAIELKVVVKSATGALVIYSSGHEEQPALFIEKISFGSIPIAEPILCIKAVGGPFEFDMQVEGVEEAY
jgi:hypothetical protein